MKKITLFLFIATIATAMFAQVSAPVFKTEPGTYYNKFTVEIEGSDIHYTLDGTEPTAESTAYTGGISISEFNTSTTIKAASFTSEGASDVVEATYELKVAAPVFSVKGGIYEKLTGNDALSFTTETKGATIYYNHLGKNPKEEGSRPYGQLSILFTTTVNAVAKISNCYSEIASEHYVISPKSLFRIAGEVTDSASCLISCGNKIAQPLFINEECGNLSSTETTLINEEYAEINGFYGLTFTVAEGGYNITDAYGRYMYLDEESGFYFADALPASGAVWTVDIDESTLSARITNSGNGKVIAYNAQDDTFGAYAESELSSSHIYPTLFANAEYPTLTVTPANGEEISEFSKVTVTCESGMTYNGTDELKAQWQVGTASKKSFNSVNVIDDYTVEFILTTKRTAQDTYSVIIPAGLFTIDPNGFAQANKELVIKYTLVNRNILNLTYANPANQANVKDLQYLYFEFDHDITITAEGAVIKDKKGTEFPLSVSDIEPWEGTKCPSNAMCLMTEAPLSAGTYTFTLSKEYAKAKENENIKLEKDIKYTFIVPENLMIKSVTPNDKAECESVSEITFNFNYEIFHNNFLELIVTDSNGKEYIFTKVTKVVEEGEEEDEETLYGTKSLKFTTATPITEIGEYTFTIHQDEVYREYTNNQNEEIETIADTTFTFTIIEPTGISGIKAEDGSVIIYDLTGRRADSIVKGGIYIINGNKVLVK